MASKLRKLKGNLAWAPNDDAIALVATGLIRPGDRVLEVGCGRGQDAIFYARWGCKVLAFDNDADVIAEAKTMQKRHLKRKKRVQFKTMALRDLTALAKTGKRFDVVSDRLAASNVFAKSGPLRRYLNAVRRVLRPGGLFLLRWGWGEKPGSKVSLGEIFEKLTPTVLRLFTPTYVASRSKSDQLDRFVVLPMRPHRDGHAKRAVLVMLRPKANSRRKRSSTGDQPNPKGSAAK